MTVASLLVRDLARGNATNLRRFSLATTFAVLLGTFGVGPAWGNSGGTLSLPGPGVVAKAGLQLDADWRWVSGVGYRPVRVTISTLTGRPATADRRLRVELVFHSIRLSSSVSETLELPAGVASVTRTVLAPPMFCPQTIDWKVVEDGMRIDELCVDSTAALVGNMQYADIYPSLLIIDADAPGRATNFGAVASGVTPGEARKLPDLRRLPQIYPVMANSYGEKLEGDGSDGHSLQLLKGIEFCELLPFAELPENWLEYSGLDMAFISRTDFERLKAEQLKKWICLRQWTAAGGTLGVFDAGESPTGRQELDALLAFSSQGGERKSGAEAGDWRAADAKNWTPETMHLADFFRSPAGVVPQAVAGASANSGGAVKAEGNKTGKTPSLQIRSLQFGRVVAMSAAEPFIERPAYWECFFKSLEESRWAWSQRHGLSLTRPNNDFWNFLIPGVGRTPIVGFVVMITLFMIVVGPVNYYVLRRRGKLVLQLVTIPAAGAAMTSGLLLYALTADGLHMRARVRSLTSIDQREQRLVAWSRQAYYAGLSPSRGLLFPRDTAVYPLEFDPPSPYESSPRRTTHWGEQQNLLGYLAARTPTQFITVRSCETAAQLLVRDRSAAGERPNVENRLGARAVWLLVCDSRGELHWGDALAEGERRELEPISRTEAAKKLAAIFKVHEPAFPAGAEGPMTGADFQWQSNRRYWGGNFSPLQPATGVSELEQQIRRWKELASPPAPRSFLTQLDKPPASLLGADAREEASFHLVEGKW